MGNKFPGFLLNPKKFLFDTAVWPPVATGMYVRCLCYQWDNKSLPPEPEAVKRICVATTQEFCEGWPFVEKMFEYRDGRLVCDWLTEAKGCWNPRAAGTRAPRQMDVAPSIWQWLRKLVIARDGDVCRYCGEPTDNIHIDHVLPLSRGGKSTEDNLVVACGDCHVRKGARTPEEWKSDGR